MKERILMILPAYNEEDNILKAYNKICEYNNAHKTNYDVIVINDCSTDNTLKICLENKIPVIPLIHNLGIGGAVQTGYKYALENDYDVALQYDGDGQHDVKYVENIIRPILNGEADLVIGSRFIDDSSSEFKSSFARQLGIKVISFFIKFVSGKKIYDVTSGFRAAGRLVIEDFAKSYPIDYPEPITNAELLKKKYEIKEVPVSMNEREGGISSINSWKTVYFMINVVLSILVVGIRRFKHVK
ncbi:glycosyltransferase family 2 protein [Thomasclavelia cocleata]|jgi:glycosyltransferase involved in cell wall biosynthesis|uniref:glycosyltransferase family 2 protein n=1 Tax=Thomasclavelia cocleata TaxID=69824 RepID=UPI00241ECBD4|nr:glycosyltransferase family 2 protein [Thomasclavelia cocleata]MCI9629470.1 glycosyltransferase family 2 protein [Thomasclavelia cocleata]